MSEKKNIDQVLEEFIARKILMQKNRRIHPKEPLITSGLLDSFHLLDIALYIEDTYNIKLDDVLLQKSSFNTLEELITLVKSKMK
jgi:acyl carrier protein